MNEMNDTLTDLLRRELPKMGTLTSIEAACGVKRQALARFLRGQQSLRLDFADRLATFLGVEYRLGRRGK